jgi:hypothetical protein
MDLPLRLIELILICSTSFLIPLLDVQWIGLEGYSMRKVPVNEEDDVQLSISDCTIQMLEAK